MCYEAIPSKQAKKNREDITRFHFFSCTLSIVWNNKSINNTSIQVSIIINVVIEKTDNKEKQFDHHIFTERRIRPFWLSGMNWLHNQNSSISWTPKETFAHADYNKRMNMQDKKTQYFSVSEAKWFPWWICNSKSYV